MSASQNCFVLPDILRNWPWKTDISPHFEGAKAESVTWIESFVPFSPKAQAAFNKCNFSLLAAYTYPKSNYYNFRSCCDLMHATFVIDEYTDKTDTADTKAICEAAMDAIMHPDKPRPEGENVVGEICRQFWQRARRGVPTPVQERFVGSWERYLDAVALQSKRRTTEHICTIDEYLATRSDNAGGELCLVFAEICLEIDIPHEIMQHPLLTAMTGYISFLIGIGNDLYSYKHEYLHENAEYNAIAVVMAELVVDLPTAVEWVSDLHDEIVDKFLKARDELLAHKDGAPSWGPEMDSAVRSYIDGIGQWLRGTDEWHFHSERYFGEEGPVIQKTREVTIGSA